MRPIDRRHVNVVIGPRGRRYFYHRKTGERLPDDPVLRAARVAELNIDLARRPPAITPGTFDELIARYKASPSFHRLKPRTQIGYGACLDLIRKAWGDKPVARLEARHVEQLQMKLAGTPRKADYVVTVLRLLLAYAVKHGYRQDNPALRPGRVNRTTSYKPWPDEALETFFAAAPAELVLAAKLALYTGQRLGDLIRMTWGDYDAGTIRLAQNKTGAPIMIPVAGPLREALDATKRSQIVILTTSTGRPWTAPNLSHQFSKAVKAAGLSGLVFHGLRHTAAVKLAEAGCSALEIQAITGHRGLEMVETYTRQANQERLAGKAIKRLETSVPRGNLQNPSEKSAKRTEGGGAK